MGRVKFGRGLRRDGRVEVASPRSSLGRTIENALLLLSCPLALSGAAT